MSKVIFKPQLQRQVSLTPTPGRGVARYAPTPTSVCVFLTLLAFCCAGVAWGQDSTRVRRVWMDDEEEIDTTHTLETVEIIGKSPKMDGTLYCGDLRKYGTHHAWLAAQHGSEAEAFRYLVPEIFVRSYGPNGVASVSIRGASASQTAVLWNGIPLQNGMHGQLDASLAPVLFSDKSEISMGGGSAQYGNGSIGGTLLLNNEREYRSRAQGTIGLGSFGRRLVGASINHVAERHTWRMRTFYQAAENNFSYRNDATAGSPEVRQSNAALAQGGLQAEHYFHSLKKNAYLPKNSVKTVGWWQTNDRKIPPTMLQGRNLSNQQDDDLRLMTEWRHRPNDTTSLTVRGAWFDEAIVYDDPESSLHSVSRIQAAHQHLTWYSTAMSDSFHHEFEAGWRAQWLSARSDGYGGTATQWRMAPFASWRISERIRYWKIWEGRADMQPEIVDGRLRFVAVSLSGFRNSRKNHWRLEGKISRDYRLPTFNDLYWKPGGNSSLKPEQSLNQELGLSKQGDLSRSSYPRAEYELEMKGYHYFVHDAIQWLPEGAIWSAHNVQRVRTRGLETKAKFVFATIKQMHCILILNYTFVRATYDNDKQLIYTPMHLGGLSLELGTFHRLSFRYAHQLVGARFTTTDNSQQVPAYHTGRASIVYRSAQNERKWHRRHYWEACFSVDNLWGARYQVIQWRPMPMQQFQLNINWFFDYKKLVL